MFKHHAPYGHRYARSRQPTYFLCTAPFLYLVEVVLPVGDRRLSNASLIPTSGLGDLLPPIDVRQLNVSLLLTTHSHEKHLSVAQEALFSRFKQSAAIKKESQSPEISSVRYLLASAAKFLLVAWIFLIKDRCQCGLRERDFARNKKEGWVTRREPTPVFKSLNLTSAG